ncbi:Phosphoglycerate mutase [Pseudodesulfovibrio mercurii]|uniref:Phosphoglycerate mutase n=1 Tax=Pseudodesulfovibrio mercurii TaxID=641491 RepID=F0JDJ9_9BACT|nr:histidine phosphatase family protein [Pseudodesulfovibrio mercurii]EGB13368.1 Phosphoglycerate mutase [Pseudodesulfovibrio mercurii]
MIVLLRHARTEGGRGMCVGRTPLLLSPEGHVQALDLAGCFVEIPWARLCSSPARRARETLSPLAARLGRVVDILPALDEIDMGAWDGLPFEVLRERFPEAYAARGQGLGRFRVPGGESFADVADRAMAVLEELARGPQPVLAATHAGVLRAVRCRLTGHPLDDLFRFTPGNAQCTVLGTDGGLSLAAADLDAPAVRELF